MPDCYLHVQVKPGSRDRKKLVPFDVFVSEERRELLPHGSNAGFCYKHAFTRQVIPVL